MIKKLVLTILILMATGCSGGFQVKMQGIDVNNFKKADPMEVVTGAVASLLVHEVGHMDYHEIRGQDWELGFDKGLEVRYVEDYVGNARWSTRSGLLLQSIVGLILSQWDKIKDTDFTKGFTAFNTIQLMTYPARRGDAGDYFNLTNSGNFGNGEFSFYTGLSLYNFHQAMKGK